MERKGFPRPIYLLRDVGEFIREARKLSTAPLNPSAIAMFEVDLDPTIHCPWQARTVKPTFH
jgi:hypothetical protein